MSQDNNTWVRALMRPSLQSFQAYKARGGAGDALHMDANESPWSPPPSDQTVLGFNRYPEQQPSALRARLAGLYGVEPDQIMMGRGADEAIDILLRTFCEPGHDKILICPPTFGYFSVAATIQGAEVLECPLDENFNIQASSLLDMAVKHQPKIIFLCSPNNPTGNSLDPAVVDQLCQAAPNSLVVVDEAYIEFSKHKSLINRLPDYRNLVITRTLSKVYGLAGVRMGVAIADASIIDVMLGILPPYPVPKPVEKAVSRALAPASMAVYHERLSLWKSERARLMEALSGSEFIDQLYPSDANFILFKAKNIPDMLRALSTFNVKIRDFRSKIKDHFRLSIGSPEENDIALAAFGITLKKQLSSRIGEVFRKTNETDIAVRVELDNPKVVKIDTGLGFFDHMLEQIAKHGGMGLTLSCDGDLEIDAHHSVEDTALAFGEALKKALGNKAGIGRYGFVMPMDETQAKVAIDLSGRPSFTFKGAFPTDHVGAFPAEMCPHFFQSLSQSLGASIQIDVTGENTHHMIEASFKGVGRALRPALARGEGHDIPSTKGVL